MITRRTKIQLLIFVLITLLGVTLRRRPLRPARPARSSTTPTRSSPTSPSPAASSPAPRSPTAASASARSSELELTDEGVDVVLEIDND